MKLHLGCGQRYLDGYVNVDFPLSEHTVQLKSVADQIANLLDLRYPPASVDEIRLHHVFEHFSRPTAFGLLAGWNTWLKQGGHLRIEVPDLFWSSLAMLNPFNKRYLIATRHLFGSHEAPWAIHCEGWSKRSLKLALGTFGFEPIKFRQSKWLGTSNIEVIAEKTQALSLDVAIERATTLFSSYLLDHSVGELSLQRVWLKEFREQFSKM